jgi:hypothetical protein
MGVEVCTCMITLAVVTVDALVVGVGIRVCGCRLKFHVEAQLRRQRAFA